MNGCRFALTFVGLALLMGAAGCGESDKSTGPTPVRSTMTFFVTRAKSGMDARRVYSAPADRISGVICDQRIMFNGFYSAKNYPEHLLWAGPLLYLLLRGPGAWSIDYYLRRQLVGLRKD